MIGKVHLTKDYARYRQFSPKECKIGSYRTKSISKNTKLILCKSNGKYQVQSIIKKRN